MLKNLMDHYNWLVNQPHCRLYYNKAEMIIFAVSIAKFVHKGQQQMMADYMMLELLEQGRL